MTATVDEDFGAFVAARWPDLEAVALVGLLDPTTARAVTAAALAAVRSHWTRTLDSGSPTAEVRLALVERLAAAPSPRGTTEPTGAPSRLLALAADPDSGVPAALLEALAAQPPVVRALVAAGSLWELTADELDRLAGAAGRGGVDLAPARRDLVAAHRQARAGDGSGPADHLLEADLASLTHRLAAAQPDPPDPTSLVEERVRRVRRRTLALAAGGATAVGLLGWAVAARASAPAPARPRAASPTTAGPDDPAWASTRRWPSRGTLASDLGIQARAEGYHTARLLYADDVHDVRLVVALDLLESPPRSSRLQVWAGSVGAPAEQLIEVPYAFTTIYGVEDVVALGVPHPTGALFVGLTRPGVAAAELSATVRPTRAGTVERTFRPVALEDGVGSLLLDRPWGGAMRVHCDRYVGAVPTPEAWSTPDTPTSDDAVPAALAAVSTATGVPAEDLRATVVVDATTPTRILVAGAPGGGHVVVVHVTTPDGALVRTVRISDGTRTVPRGQIAFGPVVLPADDAERPFVQRLDAGLPHAGRFLVIAPGRATTAQLVATTPTGRPVSTVVPLVDHVAVVAVVNADAALDYRLVLRDATGRTVHDAVPAEGADLFGPDEGVGPGGIPVLPNPA